MDTKVKAADREQFEQLRDQVRSADDGQGLPEGVPFDEWWFIEPPVYFAATATATRAAFRR